MDMVDNVGDSTAPNDEDESCPQEDHKQKSQLQQPWPKHVPIPPYFLCPINNRLMEHPVVDREGHSYEREAILRYLSYFEDPESGISPITKSPLRPSDLVDNRALRRAIDASLKIAIEQEKNLTQSAIARQNNKAKGRRLLASSIKEVVQKVAVSGKLRTSEQRTSSQGPGPWDFYSDSNSSEIDATDNSENDEYGGASFDSDEEGQNKKREDETQTQYYLRLRYKKRYDQFRQTLLNNGVGKTAALPQQGKIQPVDFDNSGGGSMSGSKYLGNTQYISFEFEDEPKEEIDYAKLQEDRRRKRRERKTQKRIKDPDRPQSSNLLEMNKNECPVRKSSTRSFEYEDALLQTRRQDALDQQLGDSEDSLPTRPISEINVVGARRGQINRRRSIEYEDALRTDYVQLQELRRNLKKGVGRRNILEQKRKDSFRNSTASEMKADDDLRKGPAVPEDGETGRRHDLPNEDADLQIDYEKIQERRRSMRRGRRDILEQKLRDSLRSSTFSASSVSSNDLRSNDIISEDSGSGRRHTVDGLEMDYSKIQEERRNMRRGRRDILDQKLRDSLRNSTNSEMTAEGLHKSSIREDNERGRPHTVASLQTDCSKVQEERRNMRRGRRDILEQKLRDSLRSSSISETETEDLRQQFSREATMKRNNITATMKRNNLTCKHDSSDDSSQLEVTSKDDMDDGKPKEARKKSSRRHRKKHAPNDPELEARSKRKTRRGHRKNKIKQELRESLTKPAEQQVTSDQFNDTVACRRVSDLTIDEGNEVCFGGWEESLDSSIEKNGAERSQSGGGDSTDWKAGEVGHTVDTHPTQSTENDDSREISVAVNTIQNSTDTIDLPTGRHVERAISWSELCGDIERAEFMSLRTANNNAINVQVKLETYMQGGIDIQSCPPDEIVSSRRPRGSRRGMSHKVDALLEAVEGAKKTRFDVIYALKQAEGDAETALEMLLGLERSPPGSVASSQPQHSNPRR